MIKKRNYWKIFNNLWIIILLGILIRIYLAATCDTGDTGAINLATKLLLQNKEVYNNPTLFFSPPPFELHVVGLLRFLLTPFHIPFQVIWKLPPIFADAGITILIFLFAKKYFNKTKQNAIEYARWYMWNPVAIIISGAHGQQESVWLFFIFLAWYLVAAKKTFILVSLASAIAVSYKLTAVFLLPVIFLALKKFYKRIIFACIIGILFVISLFPEIQTSTNAVIRQSFQYSSTPGIWGITLIINRLLIIFGIHGAQATNILLSVADILKKLLVVFLGLYFLKSYFQKDLEIGKVSIAILSIFYIVTPGFGAQYLLWILPFLVVTNSPYTKIYTLLVTFALLHFYTLPFVPLNAVRNFLELNIYYKIGMNYPFELLLPVWILFIMVLFSPNRIPAFVYKTISLIEKESKKRIIILQKRYFSGK